LRSGSDSALGFGSSLASASWTVRAQGFSLHYTGRVRYIELNNLIGSTMTYHRFLTAVAFIALTALPVRADRLPSPPSQEEQIKAQELENLSSAFDNCASTGIQMMRNQGILDRDAVAERIAGVCNIIVKRALGLILGKQPSDDLVRSTTLKHVHEVIAEQFGKRTD
jgi:hypothetical protein